MFARNHFFLLRKTIIKTEITKGVLTRIIGMAFVDKSVQEMMDHATPKPREVIANTS